jgi:acyl phosphate:glycerol-3-phosphate acyltransferase
MEYLALIAFYILGTFPSGKIVSRAYGVEIEREGSGNIGATNVARVIGRRAGIYTLLGDVLKGVLGTATAHWLLPEALVPYAAIALVAGHCFSIPGVLKGGKGVATALGVIVVLHPFSGLFSVAIFVSLFALTRIVSIASVTAALMLPVAQMLSNMPSKTIFPCAVIGLLVAYRHIPNLKRLIHGTEPRFQSKG